MNFLKSNLFIIVFVMINYCQAQIAKTCDDFKNIIVIDKISDNQYSKIVFDKKYHTEFTSENKSEYIKSKIDYNKVNPCVITLEIIEVTDKNFPFPIGEKMILELTNFENDNISYVAKVRDIEHHGVYKVLSKLD